VLQTYAYLVGARDFVDFGGYKYHSTFPEGREGNSMWVDQDEHRELGKKFMNKVLEDREFSFFLINDCYKLCNELVANSKEICNMNLLDASDGQLKEAFSIFMKNYMKLTRYMLTPHFVELALSESIRKWLFEKLHDESKVDETFMNIAIPSKETSSIKEQKSLLRIAAEVKKYPTLTALFTKSSIKSENSNSVFSEIGEMIEDHTAKYAWMPMVSMINPPRGKQEFLMMISDVLKTDEDPIQKLKMIEQRTKEEKNIVNERLEGLNMPDEIVDYVKALQDFIFLRTFRMEVYGQAHYYVQPLFAEISKKAKLTPHETKYLTHLEILDFFETRRMISLDEIRERMIAYAFVMRNGVISEVFAGKKAAELREKELAEGIS